jgi:magnesium transporter
VVDVIQQEAEEDLLRMGGVGDEELSDTVFAISRSRVPWLLVNLATAFVSATVISQFGATIEEMVALAALMPIVASLGGNAGTQTMTVTVRALATKDLDIYNAARVVRREVMVGMMNGSVIAVIIGVVAGTWFGNPQLGLVIAVAMIINMVAAALAGILIPLLLDRLGADPAISSSIFTTMITDVIGFFAFLGLASWWLQIG